MMPEPLVAVTRVVDAGEVGRIVAEHLGKEDPAGLARRQHVRLAARLMDAENIGRIE